MIIADVDRTIVQKGQAYSDFAHVALHNRARLRLQELCEHVPSGYFPDSFSRFAGIFECFLRITGQRLVLAEIRKSATARICETFLAALFCEMFYDESTLRKQLLANSSFELFMRAGVPMSEQSRPGYAKRFVPSPALAGRIKEFESCALDEGQVWLWSAWPSTSRAGKTTHFPLYYLYENLGRTFTERLCVLANEFFAKQRSSIIYCLRPLVLFIRDFKEDLTPDHFLDREFLLDFWRNFFVSFFVEGYKGGDGAKLTTLSEQWGQFTLFVNGHLIPGELVANTGSHFPTVDQKDSIEKQLHVRHRPSGESFHNKLLTDIPLEVSDTEAIELLFRAIQADFRVVKEWANHQIDGIWARHLRARALAKVGTPVAIGEAAAVDGGIKRWLTSRKNPDCLSNAAATSEKYGHIHSAKFEGRLPYPIPLPQTAFELGLPITDSLLPHCFLLVAEHPSITPAFLEDLELFDKDGQQTGFVETDGGAVLVGLKRRRGAERAQQQVKLNEHTTCVVRQIIALTTPIRVYLEARKDDRWRLLLLTCLQGFGYPRKIARLTTGTSMFERQENVVLQLKELNPSLSEEQLRDFVRRLSLPAVRASAGVITYLETHSVKTMAEALDHAEYKPELLNRYLPKCIREFFQERWIRLFQNGLILEAMGDSEHAVRASDFSTLVEVNSFLIEHALHLPSDAASEAKPDQRAGELVFGVNVEILTMLLSVTLATEEAQGDASELARFWSAAATNLAAHIEAGNTGRPDIEGYLRQARKFANAELARDMVQRA